MLTRTGIEAMLALRESLRQTQEALRWALRQDGHMTWCQHQVLGHPCEPDCPYARALELQKEEASDEAP